MTDNRNSPIAEQGITFTVAYESRGQDVAPMSFSRRPAEDEDCDEHWDEDRAFTWAFLLIWAMTLASSIAVGMGSVMVLRWLWRLVSA